MEEKILWHTIPKPIQALCTTLWEKGGEAYPVGGCLRDCLLGRTPDDWDVTTSFYPEDIISTFEKVIPTGVRHGTVTVLLEGYSIEVTTFRKESVYSDGRHPDAVDFHATLLQDLSRRDFTINAMALDPNGTIIDPFGGQRDLTQTSIRCVGNPDHRFQEDGLRLLRGIRFSAQLGFTLEPSTAAALFRQRDALEGISKERIYVELEKILLSPNPHRMQLAFDSGMLTRFGSSQPPTLALCDAPCHPLDRWRVLCDTTGLDITTLPVPRKLRLALLHPQRGKKNALPITGGDLYAQGYRGKEIGTILQKLLVFLEENPNVYTKDELLEKCIEFRGQV